MKSSFPPDQPPYQTPEEVEALMAGRSDQEIARLAALGLMTTGIVHDFGNLMQVISSAVDLIERKLEPPKRAELSLLTQGVLASVGRATALSRKILSFSRAETTVEEVMHIDLALGALEQPIRWMAGDAIRVELDLDGDLPPVFCDVREFENAVLNLVVNAREAMPEGGELCIAASRGGLEDDAIVILRVTDTGRGMSPETAKRAFQPRFTTKAIGRGNGLGLAMVADFVRRVGGSAQIESTPRQGTSIVLRIPGCGN